MSSSAEARIGRPSGLALLMAGAILIGGCLPTLGLEAEQETGQTPGPEPETSTAKPPGHYDLGTRATAEMVAGWDIDVRPDGAGLPAGSGSVQDGGDIYQVRCASCHGTFGEGTGQYAALSGGAGTLTDERPEKTVGSYWPYATTLWDYIHRAMPFYAPQSLTDDEVYAITAYVLNLNGIVDAEFVADRDSLPEVAMPNEGNFIWDDPRPDTNNTRCMQDCATDVKIVDSAAGKNLTPRTTGRLDEGLSE